MAFNFELLSCVVLLARLSPLGLAVGIINRREREPTVSYGERSRNGVRMSWRREKMEFYDCFINKFIASQSRLEVGKLLNNHRCGIASPAPSVPPL
jgi:hypothetical protein